MIKIKSLLDYEVDWKIIKLNFNINYWEKIINKNHCSRLVANMTGRKH